MKDFELDWGANLAEWSKGQVFETVSEDTKLYTVFTLGHCWLVSTLNRFPLILPEISSMLSI